MSICFTKVHVLQCKAYVCDYVVLSLSLSYTCTHTYRVPVYEYVCYYLLYLIGGRILLNTLAIGVDTVNYLYNTRHRYMPSTI